MTRTLPVAAGLSALLALAYPAAAMPADPVTTDTTKTAPDAKAKTDAEAEAEAKAEAE